MFKKFKLRLKAWFLTGLFVLLPLVVSVKVFLWFLTFVDDLLKPVLEDIFGRYFFSIAEAMIRNLKAKIFLNIKN